MTHAVLFTQCLQRDFISPVSPHAPLPNALHVGREEALRIMGREPARGPVAQLMRWVREQDPSSLTVVHVRDWHDPSDAEQAQHLDHFGGHCVAGTPGARLVLDLDAQVAARPNEHFVDATGLNDFQGTRMAEVLASLPEGEPVRAGVVGVWTEAKVTFLLYELATRLGWTTLGTCSALTASASRTQHFNALDQLRKLLGVRVLDSVGEFAGWLKPGSQPLQVALPDQGYRPRVVTEPPLACEDLDLVSALYRDAAEVRLDPIGGGYSGAQVYRVACEDSAGHQLAPTVLKLGPRDLIADERVAFERVEAILGNDAPSVRGFADFGARGGLKFAYAAMGDQGVQTFQSLYADGMAPARVRSLVDQVFGGILERLTSASKYERLNLLEAYTFEPRFAAPVQAQVEAILGAPAGDRIEVLPGCEVMNPAVFYRDHLDVRSEHAFHYTSHVHGDLNGANILVDARDNVWIIDFARARRTHVLTDVAKFENDLQYIMTPLENEDELRAAMALTRGLVAVEDLAAPLPAAIKGVDQPVVRRALGTLRAVRAHTGRLCREERNPAHMALGLLRYAVHTLSFDEPSPLQKRWALYAAGAFADAIVADARRNARLRVDWIADPALRDGERIGITICPGRADRGRDLGDDLASLREQGVDKLVCLLPNAELEHVGVGQLADRVRDAGMGFVQAPILDQQAAPLARIAAVVSQIEGSLEDGKGVVVHCMGGLGRSGMVVAGLLTRRGLTHSQAVAAVRRARGPRAVETLVQEHLVRDLERAERRNGAPVA